MSKKFLMDYDNIPGKGPKMLFRDNGDGTMSLATVEDIACFEAEIRSLQSDRTDQESKIWELESQNDAMRKALKEIKDKMAQPPDRISEIRVRDYSVLRISVLRIADEALLPAEQRCEHDLGDYWGYQHSHKTDLFKCDHPVCPFCPAPSHSDFCPKCNGKGYLSFGPHFCSDCNGTGKIPTPSEESGK